MKPELKIEGREATPAEYAHLMQALLASQAATPTAKAVADADAKAPQPSVIDALFGAEIATPAGQPITGRAPRAKGEKHGERAVYPPVSGFLEATRTTSPVSKATPQSAPDRYE